MIKRLRILYRVLLFTPFILLAQGNYYVSIDTASASFITDLHNLIYPHTRITYANFASTNVANFASRDTTGGQKVVTCVYSGENYVYTPPFAWGTYSREHTWCQSWMPSGRASGFENRPEYSDQHHIFPVNQNKANGIRSNHPEGNVVTPTYTYLLCKWGTDSRGATVFEPRSSHKGDVARALFYMAVCYNGVDGFDWTFNNLNRVLVDSLREAPQDVATLLQWHQQDPPDQWEKDRNNYVYSIQENRNPFIDHPEYVNLIDFNTLTRKVTSPVVLADEPTNYPNGFNTPAITSSSITVTWTDPTGSILPSGYLLLANTINIFSDPEDGKSFTDNSNLNAGSAVVNVPYGTQQFTFSGLTSATNYSFRLYPYNGNGTARKYKTSNFPQTLTTIYSTLGSPDTVQASVVINEYMNGSATSAEWVELLVLEDNLDMRGMVLRDYSGSGSVQTSPLVFSDDSLWSSIPHGTFIVVLGNGNSTPEDLFIDDKKLMVNSSNALYFSGTSFNISGTTDCLEILSSRNRHIHALSHGNKPGAIASIPQPWVNVSSSSSTGNVVRFFNTSLPQHFADNTKAQHSSTATMGAANDPVQQAFVNQMLPVELQLFQASVSQKGILLSWKTATETNNYGFEIERSEKKNERNSPWKSIGFVNGNGTTSLPHSYSFVDKNIFSGTSLYRLKQIDRSGEFSYSDIVSVNVQSAPAAFSLNQNFPNPFNPTTTIIFSLPQEELVTLKVFDILGNEISTLVNEKLSAGTHTQLFSPENLSSGIYFLSMKAGKFSSVKKMIFSK